MPLDVAYLITANPNLRKYLLKLILLKYLLKFQGGQKQRNVLLSLYSISEGSCTSFCATSFKITSYWFTPARHGHAGKFKTNEKENILKTHNPPKNDHNRECRECLARVSLKLPGAKHGAHYSEGLLQMKWPFIGGREPYDMSPTEQQASLRGWMDWHSVFLDGSVHAGSQGAPGSPDIITDKLSKVLWYCTSSKSSWDN